MLSANRIAFKEWAAICAGLSTGAQQIILRKGGIHEGREGLRVEHPEFWLFPTAFHQSGDELNDAGRAWLAQACDSLPSAGTIAIQLYAVVHHVTWVTDESLLDRLTGWHGWSTTTVHERFHYRQPGLFVLTVQVFRRPRPWMIPDSPHFAGCRSWVDLPEELSTEGVEAVSSERDFRRTQRQIEQLLEP